MDAELKLKMSDLITEMKVGLIEAEKELHNDDYIELVLSLSAIVDDCNKVVGMIPESKLL